MKKKIASAVVVFSIVTLLACGSDNDPAGPAGWNNGSWTGETASSIPVSFSLDHPTITSWTMTVTHSYKDTTDVRTWLCSSTLIAADSSFSWSDSIDHDTLKYVFSFSGAFINGDSLIGLWDSSVEYKLGSGGGGIDDIGGSWTATGPE